MVTVVGLRCSSLPNIPSLRIPSCFHSATATKPQLSLSDSSLSLPQTFVGRPLHRPVSCKRYGSLHRGTKNVPLTPFFPRNFSRIHSSKGKADETSMECPSSQKGTDEDRRSQQIQDSVKCQQQCHLDGHATLEMLEEYWTCLTVKAKDSIRAYKKLHHDIMTVVKALQTAGNHDVAVKILKAYDPLAVTYAAVEILKLRVNDIDRAYHKLDENVKAVVETLQTAGNHDVAVKILKAYEPLAARYGGEDALQPVELELMKSLQALGKYPKALEYWIQLCNKQSVYLQKDHMLQYGLLWAVMTEVSKCLRMGIGETTVPDNLTKNIGDTVDTLKRLKEGEDEPGGLPTNAPQ